MKTFLLMLFTAFNLGLFAQDTSVVQLEYFFDKDKGVGKNTLMNVTPATDGTFPVTADVGGLPAGYHKLYMRIKDSNGKWGFTARRNTEIFLPEATTILVSGEYFIDSDPGYGLGIPLTVATPDSATLHFNAVTAGLSVGYHKLYGRLKDNLGRWSSTFRRNIEVYNNDTSYVYKAEYFFKTDNGYGNCTEVRLASPSVDGTFSFTIPCGQISEGADTLFIRVQDSAASKWSLTAVKNIPKTVPCVLPLTLLSFNVIKQNNTAQLAWQTSNEINTAYFNVQRSTDARIFNGVGKVTAKNNVGDNNYAFTDDISQLSADKIYYRLEMADKDGKLNYSKVEYIDINHLLTIAINPNPAVNDNATLNIYSPVDTKLQLMIYSGLSKLVYKEQFSMRKGSLHKSINLSNLAAGIYSVMVTDGSSLQTLKLIKQ